MKNAKKFQSFLDAGSFLGEDFWELLTDVLPFLGPRIDVVRNNNEVFIVAEIPGIESEKDLKLNWQGQYLIIKGEYNRPYLHDKYEIIKEERFSGPFKRKIKIPDNCIPEKMKAIYKNGLLQIVIPVGGDDQAPIKNEIPVYFVDDDLNQN
ncbi:Hsp20/alpha crystallin family protein [Calidifontibacillus erzurumensis]|uniref:Hsp20/alpha crystallin family protein n=1 Tax=Calidifontibacillus erzurumensis TaxID=2741433 RepID=A0A8J8GC74_9BACI|nr:Hsp20/alpha crystallin family protein [Calidifontibacillus erzurumensis]NSL51002.1 Hsp20/alpha crystallin family protein [Calidifontibacillus erzurumensis]